VPKLHLTKFEGDNPRLWISRAEDYFEMYDLDPSVWVKFASMHFTAAAGLFLPSKLGRPEMKLEINKFKVQAH